MQGSVELETENINKTRNETHREENVRASVEVKKDISNMVLD